MTEDEFFGAIERFTVWKKVGEEYEELKITKYQFLPFDYLKPIIEFLKK